MIGQPNRLVAEGEHRFKGSDIDRTRPLHFRLDGRAIRGFAGDTVLSAALASGIIGAGTRNGEPLALDERFAPPVLLQRQAHDLTKALPMQRLPAIGGLDLVTLDRAVRPRYRRSVDDALRLWPPRRARLDANHDGDAAFTLPWLDLPASRQIDADLAIVGGGLAGMSAALAAARRGQRVVLIERRQSLGGDARYFGSVGEEETPEAAIARLKAAIADAANIVVLLRAEAFVVFEGLVQVSQVEITDDLPAGRVLTINAPRIVLANGTLERLPIFTGNRRPGIVGAPAAFDRAERFGVWIGKRSLFATSTSYGYRLATQAKNAGITVERIADTRVDPQSRFVEFGKAYGIPMMRATRPILAQAADRYGRGLQISLEGMIEGGRSSRQVFTVDQLVLGSIWQPDLTLWHIAGGTSRWDAASHRLIAEGALPGIALAGALAGYRNSTACLQSGEAAAATLFGRPVPDVEDRQIDTRHESPDDPTSIAPFEAAGVGEAYLDGATSLATQPAPRSRRLRFWPKDDAFGKAIAEQARPLSVGDVAAGVQLGAIPPGDAAIVAQERCVTPGDIVDAGRLYAHAVTDAGTAIDGPPAFLAGRFGAKAASWLVAAADARRFEVGCLIYPGADRADPLTAIGVVFAPAPDGRDGGLALVGNAFGADQMVSVRDISGPITAWLRDPTAPDDSTAAAAAVESNSVATAVAAAEPIP